MRAALAEARGDHQAAVHGYAQAAERWQRFGVVPEQASPFLARAAASSHSGNPPKPHALQQAHEIFAGLKAAPALVETDTLLQRAAALSA